LETGSDVHKAYRSGNFRTGPPLSKTSLGGDEFTRNLVSPRKYRVRLLRFLMTL